jgi:AsmA family
MRDQDLDQTTTATESPSPRLSPFWRRFFGVCALLIFIVLLALLPPLITVNRYQRRIAGSISASLGRPVHLSNVTLTLLPMPGFTLENFVVDEDPAFGYEPVIRSSSVHATLRLTSLWSRRVEFSTISFGDSTSVNLVHLPDGRWNLESILLQAAHIDAAPTAQAKAGPAPRFPYIEASGARVNLKQGLEKTPYSLTDADFALWLPDPKEWHIRLEAHPSRTDSNVTDTGVVRMEGTLGHAASLQDVALDLQGDWRNAPLGEASRLLTGHDAGLRGEMTLSASAHGTVGKSALQTRARLESVRRADFVPDHELSIDMTCQAAATNLFHGFEDVHCNWPQPNDGMVSLHGSLPDIRKPDSASMTVTSQGIPMATVLDWLHVASARVVVDLAGDGNFAGQAAYGDDATGNRWSGELNGKGLSLRSDAAKLVPLRVGDITVSRLEAPSSDTRKGRHRPAKPVVEAQRFALASVELDLGGKTPATLDGSFDANGYTLHLSGMAVLSRLQALAAAIPQLGDGMKDVLPDSSTAEPVRLDLTATRTWGGTQVWVDGTAKPVVHGRR